MVATTIPAKPRIIALHSKVPGSGKSTLYAAALACQLGFHCLPFAFFLKDMTRLFLAQQGFTPAEIELLMGPDKNKPIKRLYGVTPRWIMQSLGTDWGRDHIHRDIWLRAWMIRANEILAAGHSIVVDDLRFDNEAKLIADAGGSIFLVNRPAATASSKVLSHASEQGIKFKYVTANLVNDIEGDDGFKLAQFQFVDLVTETDCGIWNKVPFQIDQWLFWDTNPVLQDGFS